MGLKRAKRLSTYPAGSDINSCPDAEDLATKGGYEMTAQEIEDALFKEEMAQDAFRVDPSPVNKRLWEQARIVVDRAIHEVT